MTKTTRILLLATCLTAANQAAHAGVTITGKVTHRGEPLAGASVYLYPASTGPQGKAAFESQPTASNGTFEVEAAAGAYLLVAKRRAQGGDGELLPGDLYTYYGGNPVAAKDGDVVTINLSCTPVIPVARALEPGGRGIRGRVFLDGIPLEHARVTLYKDASTAFRGLGSATALTNSQGEFSFDLPPGDYFAVARRRTNDRPGPVEEGDFFGFAHQNPVRVSGEHYTAVTINGTTRSARKPANASAPKPGEAARAGETVIEGTIRDRAGVAVEGIYALAYRDPRMLQRPDFLSRRTGPDGAYSISLPQGGEYFMGARNNLGGPAMRGDLLGRYIGTAGPAVTVKTGETLRGIDIVVGPAQ